MAGMRAVAKLAGVSLSTVSVVLGNGSKYVSEENRKAVLHIYNSVNRNIYEQYQWRVCEHVTATYVDTALAGRAIPEEDRRVIIDYWKCVCFGLVSGWLEGGMQGDIRSRFHRIFQLKDSQLETMISRCLPECAPAP